MRRSPKTLNAQLDAYSAAVKPLTENGTAKLANWSVYAMATGSALAMATSANAGIIYSGPLDLTASIPPAEGLALSEFHSAHRSLHTGPFAGSNSAAIVVFDNRYNSGDLHAVAALGRIRPLGNASSRLERLAFGAVISGSAGRFGIGILKSNSSNNNKQYYHGTWPDGVVGYAGGQLSSGDFAWFKLSWSGADNFPDTITLYGWAVQTDGSPIIAGDIGPTPEPGTFGLALLAAGAAGVLAWRRRKQPASE